MKEYTPRRCSKRWLDGDCPAGVLAIIDYGEKYAGGGRYDFIYTNVSLVSYPESSRIERWMQGFSVAENGAGYDHFELEAHEVAAYRYRMKHRYTKWSTLPDVVKNTVRRDIAEAKQWAEKFDNAELVEK